MTKFRSMLIAFALSLLAMLPVFFRALASHAPDPVPTPVHKDIEPLNDLMHNKIHAEYTTLSFTIWHNRPLTPPKFTTIANSSGRLVQFSHDLNQYVLIFHQQGWGERDVRFFDDKRIQLGQVATELQHAAAKHDASQVTSFFLHLEATCQSCHKHFRPDLS